MAWSRPRVTCKWLHLVLCKWLHLVLCKWLHHVLWSTFCWWNSALFICHFLLCLWIFPVGNQGAQPVMNPQDWWHWCRLFTTFRRHGLFHVHVPVALWASALQLIERTRHLAWLRPRKAERRLLIILGLEPCNLSIMRPLSHSNLWFTQCIQFYSLEHGGLCLVCSVFNCYGICNVWTCSMCGSVFNCFGVCNMWACSTWVFGSVFNCNGIWNMKASSTQGYGFLLIWNTAHFGHCCKEKNFAVHSRLQQLVVKLTLCCWHQAAQPPCLQWQMLTGWDLSSLYRLWNVVWNMNEWKAKNSSCCTEGKLFCLVFNAYNLPGVVIFCLFSAFFIIRYLCLLSVCMPLSFLIL